MKRSFLRNLIVAAVAVGLSACSAAQLQQAQSILATASADVLNTVNAACAEYAPVAAALGTANNPTVGSYLAYGNSVCSPATGAAVSGAPADPSTAAWVGAITGALKVLAVAGVVA